MQHEQNKFKNIIIIVVVIIVAVVGLYLVPNSPLTLDGMLSKGKYYQKTGRTALALKIFKKATESYPSSYEAHTLLGQALSEVDEPELAKQAFVKALELTEASKNKFDAQIAVASIHMFDDDYAKAEEVLMSVGDPKPDKLKEKLAEVYTAWGDKFFNENKRLEAVEKYKQAFKMLDNIDVEEQQKVEDKAIRAYTEIANYFLTQKNTDEAVKNLQNCVKDFDNPKAHLKLAEIYKKQNKADEAIEEYQKAYDLDTTGTAALYLGELLVDKGVELAKKNKMTEAKECFQKAQEANPSIIIPAEILYAVSLKNIKTYLSPNNVSDELFPKLTVDITNESEEPVDNLKVQAVFMDEGKIFSRVEKVVATKEDVLESKKTSQTVTLASPDGVKGLKKGHLIQAKLYLVYGDQPDWKIARTISLSKKKTIFAEKKPAKTTVKASKPATVTEKVATKPITEKINSTSGVTTTSVTNTMPAPQPIPVPVMVQPGAGSSNVQLPPLND